MIPEGLIGADSFHCSSPSGVVNISVAEVHVLPAEVLLLVLLFLVQIKPEQQAMLIATTQTDLQATKTYYNSVQGSSAAELTSC